MIAKKWFMLAPAVSLLMGGSIAATRDTRPACVIANEWVEDNLKSLPTTYQAFAEYPKLYRLAMYPHLEASVRADMWRTHLQSYLTPGLTREQRSFVLRVVERLPVYIDVQGGAGAFQGRETAAEARRLFGDALYTAIFLDLVPRGATAEATKATEPCECDSESYCGFRISCNFSNCNPTTGCSGGGDDACTGRCAGVGSP